MDKWYTAASIILKTAEVTIDVLLLESLAMILIFIIINIFTKLVIGISLVYIAKKIFITVGIALIPYYTILLSYMIIGAQVGIQSIDIGMALYPLITTLLVLVEYCTFITNNVADIITRLEEKEKIHLQSVESLAEDKKTRMYFYDTVTHNIKKMKNIDEYNRRLVITDRFIINHKTKEIIGVGMDRRL